MGYTGDNGKEYGNYYSILGFHIIYTVWGVCRDFMSLQPEILRTPFGRFIMSILGPVWAT